MISGFTLADISGSILTPANILWLVAALIAAIFVFGSINRRRQRLTDTLRQYVDENKFAGDGTASKSKAKPNTKNNS